MLIVFMCLHEKSSNCSDDDKLMHRCMYMIIYVERAQMYVMILLCMGKNCHECDIMLVTLVVVG